MAKLITLGSHLNFSSLSSTKFIKELNLDVDISYEHSIDSAFKALLDADYLVLPIENAIDGYIQRTLDLIYKYDFFITHVNELPVDFSLVTNEVSLDLVDTIYVQFKAKNQCLNFLESLPKVKYIITDSNSESLNKLLTHEKSSAAIIPKHLIDRHFLLTIHNIHDDELNHTRFAFIEKHPTMPKDKEHLKALLSIQPKKDEVGLLYNLLQHFKNLNINLSSIISRPKTDKTSPYHFFLEINTKLDQLSELTTRLASDNQLNIKILGVY